MKVLCTICARGGSKGIKNKNIRPLLGRPLLAYTLAQARACGEFTHIAVSSDAPAILAVAREEGADWCIERPGDLAHDKAPKLGAIKHCVLAAEQASQCHYDLIVDLDATSPLRRLEDIKGAIALLQSDPSTSNVITGSRARRSPYFNLVERNARGYVDLAKRASPPIYRRQDAPDCFDMNASIYVWTRQSLFELNEVISTHTRLYEMPEECSLDIDTELDWQMVTFLMQRGLSTHDTQSV